MSSVNDILLPVGEQFDCVLVLVVVDELKAHLAQKSMLFPGPKGGQAVHMQASRTTRTGSHGPKPEVFPCKIADDCSKLFVVNINVEPRVLSALYADAGAPLLPAFRVVGGRV